MAKFFEDPNPTNDPNYLGYSKEPDRVPANQSLGTLFSNIGEIGGEAFKAGYKGINVQLKRDARDLIEPIRNANGAGVTPDEAIGIAGMGAKGRARMAAYSSTGMFDGEDAGGGTMARELPAGAKQPLSNIQKWQNAYLTGKLSDMHYNTLLQDAVSNLRSRYQGWEDEIDTAVSQITGVIPANELRRGMINEMNANLSAQMAQQTQYQKEVVKNAKYIETLYPGYMGMTDEQRKAKGYPETPLPGAYALQSQEWQVNYKAAQNNLDSKEYEAIGLDRANLTIRTFVSGVSNAMGGNLDQLAAKISARGGKASAAEVAQFNMDWENLRVQAESAVRRDMTQPVPGRLDGKSFASLMGSQQYENAVQSAMKPFASIKTLLDNGEYARANVAAKQLKETQNENYRNFYNSDPNIRMLDAMDKISPTSGAFLNAYLMANPSLLPSIGQAARGGIASKLMTGQEMSPTEAVKIYQSATQGANGVVGTDGKPVNPPAAYVRETANMYKQIIESKDLKPEEAAPKANMFFKDMNFFANMKDDQKLKLMTLMASPDKTAQIAALSKANPELWQNYKDWMKFGVNAVFQKSIADARGYVESKNYDVQFNPGTMQFEGKARNPLDPSASRTEQQYLNKSLAPINQALGLLKPVLDQDKLKAAPQLVNIMKEMGLDPDAPKQPGMLGQLWDAVVKKLSAGDEIELAPGVMVTPPQKRSDAGGPRLALNDDTEGLKNVIGKAESGGDYNAVFGMGKRNQMDLSNMTVGEVLAFQKYHTDNGSPSSAAGKYQIIRGTLDSLVREGAVSRDEKFSPETQDRLAEVLMKRRGLDDFRSGKMTKEAFLNSLAKEWAGLPTTSGMSFYAGDGLNASTVRLPKVLEALASL